MRVPLSQDYLSGSDLVKDCVRSGQYGFQLVFLLEQVLARLLIDLNLCQPLLSH